MQLSRNSLCSCGSGKKYKKCCIERGLETCMAFGSESYSVEHEDHPTILPFFTLIKDMLDAVETSKARECIVILGIVAWNIAVCVDQSSDMLKNFMATLNVTEEDREYADDIIKYLIDQKNILFPEHNRIILDFSLEDTKDKLRLKLTYGAKAA